MTPNEMDRVVKSGFKTQMKMKIINDNVYGPRFNYLLDGLVKCVLLYETCLINGYKFHTKFKLAPSQVVKVICCSNDNIMSDYYGQLQEVIKLVYDGEKHVFLFIYDWFDSVGFGVKIKIK